jgi:TPR repeat protein
MSDARTLIAEYMKSKDRRLAEVQTILATFYVGVYFGATGPQFNLREVELKSNLDVAFDLFVSASERGFPRAFTGLGIIYEFDLGKRKNVPKALESYQRAYVLGHVPAKLLLDRLKKDNPSLVTTP